MHKKGKVRWLLAALLAAQTGAAWAESWPVVPAAPVVDGSQADSAWAEAVRLPLMFENAPLFGEPTASAGEAFVATSAAGLHALVIVPRALALATAARHDGLSSEDEHIVVTVRPGEAARAFRFSVNAVGATADRIVSSRSMANDLWNGEWTAATAPAGEGYVVELSIPWATLELSPGATPVFGLVVERHVAGGRGEVVGTVPIDRRGACRECQIPLVISEAVGDAGEERTRVRWLPYLIGDASKTHNPRQRSEIDSDHRIDAGLDVRLQTASGSKGVFTLNPDFSQVESDGFVSTINQRFARSYPEKRPFFTEERGAFSTPMTLLYTRAIADPTLGAQYVRRSDSGTYAVLVADDSATRFFDVGQQGSTEVTLERRSWNGVFRMTRPVSAGDGGTWGLFTSTRHANGYSSSVLAADVSLQPAATHAISVQIAGSHTAVDDGGGSRAANGSAITASHSYAQGNYSGATTYSQSSSDFRADLGLLPRVGTRSLFHGSSLSWVFDKDRLINTGSIAASVDVTDDSHGTLLDGLAGVEGSVILQNEVAFNLGVSRAHARVEQTLVESEAATLSVSVPVARHLAVSASWMQGEAPDYVNGTGGRIESASAALVLRRFQSADGVLVWLRDEFRSDAAGARYSVESVLLRANVHPSLRHHFSLFLNGARFTDRLDPTAAPREQDVFVRMQLTYTFEPTRFSRVIAGASRTLRGGEGVSGIYPTQEIAFAKFVREF